VALGVRCEAILTLLLIPHSSWSVRLYCSLTKWKK